MIQIKMLCIATVFVILVATATTSDLCSLNAQLIQYGEANTVPFDEIASIQVNTHRHRLKVTLVDVTTITNTRINDDWRR
jgi:hypothetical protein